MPSRGEDVFTKLTILGRYTVSGSGTGCRPVALGSTPSLPIICASNRISIGTGLRSQVRSSIPASFEN